MKIFVKTLAIRRTLTSIRQHVTYSTHRQCCFSNKNTMSALFSPDPKSSAKLSTSSSSRTEVVLSYWLGDPVRYRATWDPCATPENQTKWFLKSDQVDQEIKERFGADVERLPEIIAAVTASGTTEDKLAAIILGDQMTRNMYRGTAEMYRWDSIVLPLAKLVIAGDNFMALPLTFKIFSLLPLMHSEELADQRACVDWVQRIREAAPEDEEEAKGYLDNMHGYAQKHYDIVEAWGRFPHRNAILGRENTEGEAVGLRDGTIGSF